MQSPGASPWVSCSDAVAVATTANMFSEVRIDSSTAGEDSSTDSAQTPVGWGGGILEQHTPRQDRSSDLAWRNARSATSDLQSRKMPSSRTRGKQSARPGYRRLWNQLTAMRSGPGGAAGVQSELTVEDLVALIQKLPSDIPVVPAVAESLWTLDSRAAAALLKELSKVGLTQRAFELFDWLRDLPPTHELHGLCDVFTYTTGMTPVSPAALMPSCVPCVMTE